MADSASKVFGNAKVYGDARVYGNATIYKDTETTGQTLNIHNLKLYGHNITFTDYHIQIGCTIMLYTEFLEVSKAEAKLMGLEIKYYNNIKKWLNVIIQQYYKEI